MQFKFELSKSPGRAHCTKCHWFTSYSLWETQFRIQEADSLTPYRGTQSTDPTFYIFIGHLSSVVLRNLMRSRPHNTEFNQYALPRNLINTIKRKFILRNCTSALQVPPPQLQNENILFVGTMVPPTIPRGAGLTRRPQLRGLTRPSARGPCPLTTVTVAVSGHLVPATGSAGPSIGLTT